VIPAWLTQALSRLRMQYPNDSFDAAYEGTELVIRCQDCAGSIYPVSQPAQLAQFEAHLRSRAHRAIVEMR
jgi:hypothetical protein